MHSTKKCNELWTNMIVREMKLAGITYCCLGYGSRSTPLVLALSRESSIETYHHFDERGLAFHALGYARVTKNPVAIVVTSGSAVANVYPAIMEAFEEEIPLLIITADRPSELRSMGSNQTTDQVRIFSNHVVWQSDFPPPDFQSIVKMSHSICYSLSKLHYPISGPVHLNFMFREPLEYFITSISEDSCVSSTPRYFFPKQLTEAIYRYFYREVSFDKTGIIVVGHLSDENDPIAIIDLAKRLGWPIFADITSNMRGMNSRELIPFYDILLMTNLQSEFLPSNILHFGGRLLSKRLLNWIKRLPSLHYVHISDSAKNYNPIYRLTHRFYTNPSTFCHMLAPLLDIDPPENYLCEWVNLSQILMQKIDDFYRTHTQISELNIPIYLSKLDQGFSLFISNSMPIRDADMLLFPIAPTKIFANRGVSGIDGNIGTAIGIATSLQKPLIAVLGDLAFLHDINSLLQIREQSIPIIFIIINNGGGGIFSFLPIAKITSNTALDKDFVGKHTYSFSRFAQSLDFLYFFPNSLSELQEFIFKAQKKAIPAIIEIKTEREENYRLHAQFLTDMRLAISTSTVEGE